MKYCSKCRSEYENHVNVCADCGVDLVDQRPSTPAPDPESRIVVLCREPLPRAQVVVAGLNSRGIPAGIDDEVSALTTPHFFGGTGGVKITVPEEFAEDARKALDDVRQRENPLKEVPNAVHEDRVSDKRNRPRSRIPFFVAGFIVGAAALWVCLSIHARKIVVTYDDNRDGRPDTWVSFQAGIGEERLIDSDFDGQPDALCKYDKDDLILKSEMDWNMDKKMDAWYFYEHGRCVRHEQDLDFDGKIDEFASYDKGMIREIRWSYDGSGKIDKKAFFRHGSIVEKWYDRNRDGIFEEKKKCNVFGEEIAPGRREAGK